MILRLFSYALNHILVPATGRNAIFKRYHYLLMMYLAAGIVGVNPAVAQEYNADDTAALSEDIPPAQPLDIEDLNALLPAHLRTPLPVSEPARKTKEAETPEPAETSPLESFYRDATGTTTLTQFGYGYFANRDGARALSSGAVQDDYVVGAGDRISVAFLGERKDKNVYTVDQAGTLAIDLLPPFAATGKTLGALKAEIAQVLKTQGYHGEAYISLERVRQIGVLVAGQVALPGRQALTPLQTPLEAIENAGGPLKGGSLRAIKLVRDGKSIVIDLYGVIAGADNAAPLPTLREGDRIIVPPIGATIAVTGDVRQPAIYELGADAKTNTLDAARLAGGMLSRGQNRMTLLSPQSDGRRTARVVGTEPLMMLDGGILTVTRTDDLESAAFTLAGETRSPGTYPLAQYKKLSAILRSPQAFGDDVYPLLGVIRRMTRDLSHEMIAFSPQDVYLRRADAALRDGDTVMLLARDDVADAVAGRDGNTDPLIAQFLREHTVSLKGAARLPGAWPVANDTPVKRLLDAAGGPAGQADLTHVEVSRDGARETVNLKSAEAVDAVVSAGDSVRIPETFEAVTHHSVTLNGEVRAPGTYDLMRGDTLMTLIERAGGLTDEAYPIGTVFSRAAERKREKEKFSAAARDLERAIALAAQGDDGKVDMAQMALAKDLVEELKTIEPAGRVTVEADPAILARDPAQDILLEAGDRIYVPKRPLYVRVTGEVLSPAALQFRADKKVSDYLSEAGGTTLNADKGRMFVLNPDGSAQPVSASNWARFKPVMLTPGSTIVVPRDPKPFDFIESAKDITQILSNLAITGIYAEDLVDRN